MSDKAIAFPFAIDPYGNVAFATSPPKIWDDRVVSVLGTLTGTRVQRKSYGLSPTATPFENRDGIQVGMEESVATAFATWLPSLNLIGVEVTTEGDSDVVTVRYTLPNREVSTTSVMVGALTLNGSNPPLEDLV